MIEAILLGVASWAITKYLGFGYIVPAVAGLVVGLFLRPSLLRLIGFIFPLLASVLPAVYNGFMAGQLVAGAIAGGVLFVAYVVGSLVRLVLVPFGWLGKIINLFRGK